MIFSVNSETLNSGGTLNEDFSLSIQTIDEKDEVPGFFSGGQRVRIGFAFRIALSKVLADFRGSELDTLIIDEEGFGALDEDGQKGIVEVFGTLANQFRRIIVISQIPAIADRLPSESIFLEDGGITKVAV